MIYNNCKFNSLHFLQIEKGVTYLKIFTHDQQILLLTLKGQARLTNSAIAKETGLSIPTISKLVADNAPLIVSTKTYMALTNFINAQSSKGDD